MESFVDKSVGISTAEIVTLSPKNVSKKDDHNVPTTIPTTTEDSISVVMDKLEKEEVVDEGLVRPVPGIPGAFTMTTVQQKNEKAKSISKEQAETLLAKTQNASAAKKQSSENTKFLLQLNASIASYVKELLDEEALGDTKISFKAGSAKFLVKPRLQSLLNKMVEHFRDSTQKEAPKDTDPELLRLRILTHVNVLLGAISTKKLKGLALYQDFMEKTKSSSPESRGAGTINPVQAYLTTWSHAVKEVVKLASLQNTTFQLEKVHKKLAEDFELRKQLFVDTEFFDKMYDQLLNNLFDVLEPRFIEEQQKKAHAEERELDKKEVEARLQEEFELLFAILPDIHWGLFRAYMRAPFHGLSSFVNVVKRTRQLLIKNIGLFLMGSEDKGIETPYSEEYVKFVCDMCRVQRMFFECGHLGMGKITDHEFVKPLDVHILAPKNYPEPDKERLSSIIERIFDLVQGLIDDLSVRFDLLVKLRLVQLPVYEKEIVPILNQFGLYEVDDVDIKRRAVLINMMMLSFPSFSDLTSSRNLSVDLSPEKKFRFCLADKPWLQLTMDERLQTLLLLPSEVVLELCNLLHVSEARKTDETIDDEDDRPNTKEEQGTPTVAKKENAVAFFDLSTTEYISLARSQAFPNDAKMIKNLVHTYDTLLGEIPSDEIVQIGSVPSTENEKNEQIAAELKSPEEAPNEHGEKEQEQDKPQQQQ